TKLTEKFLHAPVRVEVSRAASTGANITQRLVKSGTKPWDKRAVLRNLIKAEDDSLKNAIIFCNRKVEVSDLYKSLQKYEFDAGALHGDMDQRARMAMLENFRSGKLKLLVASDVAARGLDIPDVSHVFNFDVPIHAEDYVHRIGRTGRAGRSGKAFTIVTRSDTKYLEAIERLTGLKVEWHDGDLSTVVASESDDEAPRRGRGAPRRAGRKDEGEQKSRRGRDRRDSSEAKPAEHATKSADAPAADITEERGARKDAIKSENAERSARKASPRNDRPAKPSDRPRRDDKRHHRRDDDIHDGTVGFGDDMPAFMKIAAKV
ncbi:MAG: DEAD/DEAH box helicase, partial [Pseudomonadota bacterium]|nr:DEAD/DEAH box helicase [Pseudomonadota bacterium]